MDIDNDREAIQSADLFQSGFVDQPYDPLNVKDGETIERGVDNEVELSGFGSFNVVGKIFVRKVGPSPFVIALFQGPESLFIRGAVDCRILYGTASCFGFPLPSHYLPIISSTTSGMLSVETQTETPILPLSAWYTHQSNPTSPLWSQEDISLHLDSFVKHLVEQGSQKMANSITAIAIFKKSDSVGNWPLLRDEILGKTKIPPSPDVILDLEPTALIGTLKKGLRAFLVSPSWRSLIASWSPLSSPKEYLVCGKKHVGKSTLVRFLLNALGAKCGKVILLDCDLGQPELTAPGFISMSVLTNPLLGPSFTNIQQAQPIWQESHFLGHSSAKERLHEIFDIASMLFARYKFSGEPQFFGSSTTSENGSNPPQSESYLAPIIINTHGWVEGAGYDTLAKMVHTLRPTQVIQIISPSESLLFQPDECSSIGVSLLHLPPVVEHTGYVTIQSTEKRQMQIVSALSGSRVTYRLPWSAFRIHLLNVEVPPSQWMFVLNGSMVALMVDSTPYITLSHAATLHQTESDAKIMGSGTNHRTDPLHGSESPVSEKGSFADHLTPQIPNHPSIIDPTLPEFLIERPPYLSSYCVGVGIITSIDMHNRVFYLSTSVPKSLLLDVNTLVKGSIEIPPSLLLANAIPATPYLTADSVSAQGTGSGTLLIRNNLIRGKPH